MSKPTDSQSYILKVWASAPAGVVAIEAAIAFPVFLFIIFTIVAISHLVSVRGLVFDGMAEGARHLGVTQLHCGGAEVITATANSTRDRIRENLVARGVSLPLSDIQVTADQAFPQDVRQWNVSAQFLSQCGACEVLKGFIPFEGAFSVNISVYRDGKGCI